MFSFPPIRRPLLAMTLACAALAGTQALAQTMPDGQRREIERIVREYLVQNPEILQEAFAELEKRQQAAQRVAQAAALKELEAGLAKPEGAQAGNPSGDVTLVEFFDYNCGYCKRAISDVQALVKADPKLRVVFKDLPVLGPDSVEASRVALAVAQQVSGDKLFEYHVKLLSSRGRVGSERAFTVAKEMGLDLPRIGRDMESRAVALALSENSALGEKLGLTGTPAYVIGGEIIAGAVGEAPLRQAVASVRKCGQASC